jgi:hypothetical protein
MEQNEKIEFSEWLKHKTNARSDSEFQKILEEMGEDQIKEMYTQFKSAKSKSFKLGGVLNYVKCLQQKIAFNKKGGKMVKDCGCGGKMKAENGAKLKEKMALGGKIKEGSDNAKQDIKEGSKMHNSKEKMRLDSGKTKTTVVIPKKNPSMPNPNSKQMMAKGGKMRADETADPKVPKAIKEPINKQKKSGVVERKYMK